MNYFPANLNLVLYEGDEDKRGGLTLPDRNRKPTVSPSFI